MKNLEVSKVFLEIAGLLEITGGDAFKIRAYRRAARSVEILGEDIEAMARENRLEEIPGVGKALALKVVEVLESGSCRYLEDLRVQVPTEILEILRIPGVGAKTAALLFRELGVVGVDELEAAARAQKLRGIQGLGAKKEDAILQGIEMLKRHGKRVLLGIALPVAESVVGYLQASPEVVQVSTAGSLRRMKETVKDIDIVASSLNPSALMDRFAAMPGVTAVIRKGETEATVNTPVGNVDLRVVKPHQFSAALHHFTGSMDHNVRLRGIARRSGLKINEYGVFNEVSGEVMEIGSEEDLYQRLNMTWIPPELREDRGEVEAALEGRSPCLVSLGDIKGDLHLHTTASDGVSSALEMASAAKGLGYQYMAVCDHTKSLRIAGGLDEEDLREQAEEIDTVNEALEDFRVLKGAEVEVLPDGTLDLTDAVLEGLDLVVASIHQGFSQPQDMLDRRVEAALKNPHVDVIGHPTGRLIGRREPYALNVERLLELAAQTSTALEINASPDRLDLRDEHARKAAEKGIKLVINTDAHSVAGLKDMRFGVGTARRAWLEKADVLNTMSLEDLITYLD